MYETYNGTSLFGNFLTRTFAEIFSPEEDGQDSVDVFKSIFVDSGIPLLIKDESLTTLFYLLYARYANSCIASLDENQFLYKLQSTVFMYGPSWEKRLEIQQNLRDLKPEDLLKGGEAIYNTANAPGTSIAGLVNSEGKVDYLSGQNTTAYRKSKMEGYATLASLLETDVTKEFLDRFQNLFIKIGQPQKPLWYETEVINDNN